MATLSWETAAHKRDIARAEDALMVPYGTEVVGMQRDWNEELQSCREFSRENLQDRWVLHIYCVHRFLIGTGSIIS